MFSKLILAAFTIVTTSVFASTKVDINLEKRPGNYYLIVTEKALRDDCPKIQTEIESSLAESPFIRCALLPENMSQTDRAAFVQKEIEQINQEVKRDKIPSLALVINWTKKNSVLNTLSIQNKLRDDDSDFEVSAWDLKTENQVKMRLARRKLINQILSYQRHSVALKKSLLLQALAKDDRWELRGNGRFYNRQTKVEYSTKQTYQIYFQENDRQKNYLRAGLEILAVLGAGKALYDFNLATNKEDWDYEWKDFWSTKRWRFDDNPGAVNLGHSVAGALYYSIARNNGFNTLESYLFALAGSTVWEYAFEYHEVVSINDQIVTTVGGAVIGETLFQISEGIKSHAPNSTAGKMFAMILNPIGAFHEWMDGRKPSLEKYGFKSDQQITASVFTGMGFVTAKDNTLKPALKFGFESEVIKLPMQSVGQIRELRFDTVLSKAIFAATGTGILDGELYALLKSVFAAYYQKNMHLDAEGRLQGYNFFVGIAQGLETQYRGYEKNSDWTAVVNVIGATLDLTAYFKGARIRLTFDVFEDFAMARTYALEKYRQALADPIAYASSVKSVIEKQSYDYALGPTFRASLSAKYKQLEFGMEGSLSEWTNINSSPRFDADNKAPLRITERLAKAKVWVAYLPRQFPWLKLVLSAESIRRDGDIYDKLRDFKVKDSGVDNRVMGTIQINFM